MGVKPGDKVWMWQRRKGAPHAQRVHNVLVLAVGDGVARVEMPWEDWIPKVRVVALTRLNAYDDTSRDRTGEGV